MRHACIVQGGGSPSRGIKLKPVASGAMAHASHDDVILIISARTCAHGGWLMGTSHAPPQLGACSCGSPLKSEQRAISATLCTFFPLTSTCQFGVERSFLFVSVTQTILGVLVDKVVVLFGAFARKIISIRGI